MVTLEQIRRLEQKVHAAVDRIQHLNSENASLVAKVTEYEQRLNELQKAVDEFKHDQQAIEDGILSALSHLDQLEDRVAGSPEEQAQPVATHEPPAEAASRKPPQEAAPVDEPQQPPADSASPAEPEQDGTGPDDSDGEEPELDIF